MVDGLRQRRSGADGGEVDVLVGSSDGKRGWKLSMHHISEAHRRLRMFWTEATAVLGLVRAALVFRRQPPRTSEVVLVRPS